MIYYLIKGAKWYLTYSAHFSSLFFEFNKCVINHTQLFEHQAVIWYPYRGIKHDKDYLRITFGSVLMFKIILKVLTYLVYVE